MHVTQKGIGLRGKYRMAKQHSLFVNTAYKVFFQKLQHKMSFKIIQYALIEKL